MTGLFWLDWATLAISLHNTILLLWLGLTVLLNAEKRTWGIWLTGGALVLASAFFFSHSAILGHELDFASTGLDFWWHAGWVPVILLPLSWYAVTLWYCGFFSQPASDLHQRQRVWFALASFLTLALATFLIFVGPLPSVAQIANLQLASTNLGLFPFYLVAVLLCVILSLDALHRPAPSPRAMGDHARQHARPWFVATAIVLLIVGLCVGTFIVWITSLAERTAIIDHATIITIGVFDLVIATLIAIAILCVGQAVALYEVFTGKILPRRGLLRHWYNTVILAVGYGIVIGWALTAQLRPIYSILVTTALLTIFFALLGWRTYVERDRFIQQLRPFVTSQRLFDQLLTSTPTNIDLATPFRALCRDVLNARHATLAPLGSLAPLVPPMKFPDDTHSIPLTLGDIARFDSAQTLWVQLNATHWAIPLWSERGLIGVLTLGDKIDGGIYSQEEIEIARASGERLIDTIASAELARRLMELQRQRLAETQWLDRQARRVLHDDVLPQLHSALLTMGSPQAIDALTNAHRQISNLLRDTPTTMAPEIARLRLIGALQKTVAEEWRQAFDNVTWEIEPDTERAAQNLPALSAETLFYAAREAIRNAARYGRVDNRALNLRIAIKPSLQIIIEDDGVGLQEKSSKQGSGQGLALHSAMLAVIGGTLSIEPKAGGGTRVTLAVALE